MYIQKVGKTIIGLGNSSPESDKQDLDVVYTIDISDDKMNQLEEEALNALLEEMMANQKGNS